MLSVTLRMVHCEQQSVFDAGLRSDMVAFAVTCTRMVGVIVSHDFDSIPNNGGSELGATVGVGPNRKLVAVFG